MKPRILVLLLLIVTSFAAKAHPVDMGTVREVAMKFMNANAKVSLRGVEDLQLVTTYSISRGIAAFHVFNTPNGFVIVSADDCAMPVLGYSDEGRFDMENMPIQLQDYLQGLVEQIEYGIENDLEAEEDVARQWDWVRRTGRLHENRDGEAVEPLVTAMWAQGCYYNALCPEDPNGPCGHVLTGCAATAMAMIMHYWSYPLQGSGTHTYTPVGYPEQSVNFGETAYDWANMSDQLTEGATQEEIDAISTLLWHCGVAVNTRYGALVSTVFAELIPNALRDCFGYSDEIYFPTDIVYDENLALWLAMLKNDLFQGRPILYLGVNPSDGHAWVCDGIDSQDLLHFNWGWGGQNNGYYSLYAGIGYVMQSAILNIVPDVNPGITTQTIPLMEGWNWFSTNVEITLDDLKAALVEALPGDTITISSQNSGSTTYNGTIWRGTLNTLDVNRMYKVKTSTDCEIVLTGEPLVPAEHPITIHNGTNWIGFPLNGNMPLSDAFAGFAVSGDMVRSKDGSATYTNQWRGTLNTLVPGKGYIYKSAATGNRTFTFPAGAKAGKFKKIKSFANSDFIPKFEASNSR